MKGVLRWIGIIGGGLLGLLILALSGMWLVSANRLNRTYQVTADFSLDVPDDAARIAEGKRFYAIMCADCHGQDLAGKELSDDFLTFGQIHSANLTSGEGGVGAVYSDEDFARTIWYGVKTDGSPTVAMPVQFNRGIHQQDMENLIAYIRSAPPVDAVQTKVRPGLLFRVMHIINIAPFIPAEAVDLSAGPVKAVDLADSLAHGQYLTVLCTGCHGPDFSGGDFGEPSLIPALSTWTQAEFSRALRQGERPDGSRLNGDEMPWPAFSNFTEAEIEAIWAYLQSVEPVVAAR